MLRAVLVRYSRTPGYTRGALIIDGHTFFTIERPWRNNAQNVSCIPAGDYLCTFLPRSGSGKYRKVYHVRAVRGRSGILIHNGNLVRHSKGCVIIGSRPGTLGGLPAVLGSKTALVKVRKITKCENFMLKVIDDNVNMS